MDIGSESMSDSAVTTGMAEINRTATSAIALNSLAAVPAFMEQYVHPD